VILSCSYLVFVFVFVFVPQAPWQDDVIEKYLEQSKYQMPFSSVVPFPEKGYFNAKGRAYPDVSIYGANYFVYMNGQILRESGTSASCPVFAAMVTMWNDMRLAYNMPPLGFFAPFLYEIYKNSPEAFNDVVLGDNVRTYTLTYFVSTHTTNAPCNDTFNNYFSHFLLVFFYSGMWCRWLH
jgi:tripeptidyl-peptidase-1